MYDLLITHGRVVDGTGAPWFHADVAVANGRIAAIGRLAGRDSRLRIDATDRVVCPGFIDAHSHSDATLLVNPRAESAVRQGVTTMLVGLCGFSAGPIAPDRVEQYRTDGMVFSFEGYTWTWQSLGEYRAALQAVHPALNVATLVGHTPVRLSAMGLDNRPPDAGELRRMQGMIRAALDEGARGFSTGLTYTPGNFAATEELIQLAKVLRPSGFAYQTHMRDYANGLLDSVAEAIRIGEEAGVPVVMSHMYPVGAANWRAKAVAAIEMAEQARRRGVDVTFDITPWLRGGGPFSQCIPPWAREGGVNAMARRFRDPALRPRIVLEIEHGAPGWSGWFPPRWDDMLISRVGRPEHRDWCGRSIGDLAAERGQAPVEASLDLLVEDDGQFWIAPTIKSSADVDLILKHPLGIPIADGFALAPYGSLGQPDNPKSYGTFPRVLGHYVRERGVLGLEEAVNKMTGVPAARLHFWDRGLLRPGLAADIVVFDPATVGERATYADPNQYPVGIDAVIVNGAVTVAQDTHSGASAGLVL